jgi:carboxypeptidase family protein
VSAVGTASWTAHRVVGVLVLATTLTVPNASVRAQAVTTAAISGTVRNEEGRALPGVDVVVTNEATGVATRGRTRDDGRYTISGLEVGGPYSVVVRQIGYLAQTRAGLHLIIGQNLRLDSRLTTMAVMLEGVRAEAQPNELRSRSVGVGTFLSDSTLHRLPIADRDIYGSVRLVPQISTWYGLSAAGASPRMNGVLVDGTSEQGIYGGVPGGGAYGGKTIALDAVKEYQVLLSPYDVRHGNFAGAEINAVTRSGTNDIHGSAFYYGRYAALSRNVPFLRDARYERSQSGLSFGGPLIHDVAHFFIASEVQRFEFPALGPYLGQSPTSGTPLSIAPDTIARFQQLLALRGLDGGSAQAVTSRNPLVNLFGRVDVALPQWHSRLVMRDNYGHTDSLAFSRPSPPPTPNCPTIVCFPLASAARNQVADKNSVGVQMFTTLPSGAYNELFVDGLRVVTSIKPTAKQPLIIARIRSGSVDASLQSGTYELAQGDFTDNRSLEMTDNVTVTIGSHRLTAGVTGQLFRVRRHDVRGAFGVWQFASLDALASGLAASYHVTRDSAGADVMLAGAQYALYVGDEWNVMPRLTLTYGVRADIPTLAGRPPYSPEVDNAFGRRTDVVPTGIVQWSPRASFSLDASGTGGTMLRGGVGAFAGRPPLGWIINSYANYGAARTLSCGTSGPVTGPAPAFNPNYESPPLTCGNGRGLASNGVGSANLLDRHLMLPQSLRASLGIDQMLSYGVVATLDALYTRGLHAPFFVNRNLSSPNAVDSHGRVLYGTFASNGQALPALAAPQFSADVIELTSQSKDHSSSLTGQLAKHLTEALEASASFTYARARDVQSQRLARSPSFDNWRFGRVLAGRQDDLDLGVSDFDQPYRVVVTSTYRFPWSRWASDLSFSYLGSSGLPFTYVAGGNQNSGDLNADGTNVNDPIYIPRSALDTAEMHFTGDSLASASQAAAFDRFIDGANCLRRQRGRIMARNSCRSPWVNTTSLSLRQSFPGGNGHTVTAELQVFNFLNLVDGRWGRVAIPSTINTAVAEVNLLSQTGQTSATGSRPQPIFAFDSGMRRFASQNVDSYYQIQLAARYSF